MQMFRRTTIRVLIIGQPPEELTVSRGLCGKSSCTIISANNIKGALLRIRNGKRFHLVIVNVDSDWREFIAALTHCTDGKHPRYIAVTSCVEEHLNAAQLEFPDIGVIESGFGPLGIADLFTQLPTEGNAAALIGRSPSVSKVVRFPERATAK